MANTLSAQPASIAWISPIMPGLVEKIERQNDDRRYK
jgi:hypothetical protein